MDVKNAVVDIMKSETLRKAIGSLLCIGNFLNGREVSNVRVSFFPFKMELCAVATDVHVPFHIPFHIPFHVPFHIPS